MAYVFDASFVGALAVPDEKNPRVDKIRSGIDESEKIFAPQLLWYEIANLLNNLIRRKRYSFDEVIQFFAPIAAIRLVCDSETGIHHSQKIFRLCNECNLSSYDAAYLELAERKGAALCTLDEGLQAAAKKRGVTVMR